MSFHEGSTNIWDDPSDSDVMPSSGADTWGNLGGYASDGIDVSTPEGIARLEERRRREAGTETEQ